MLEKTGRISTALICGGSVEIDLQCSVVGRSANHRRRQKHAPKHQDGPSMARLPNVLD
jgi:hypothetical protein